jgi:hypothetical protein
MGNTHLDISLAEGNQKIFRNLLTVGQESNAQFITQQVPNHRCARFGLIDFVRMIR